MGARGRVSARAEDGTIEAIEAETGFALGVQWHPEKLAGPCGAPVLTALIERAREDARRRR